MLIDFSTILKIIELNEAYIKKVDRVRGGKIQRRKKVSGRAGYRLQGDKLVRMTTKERRNRKIAQKKAAKKRKAKLSTSLRKRKLSNRKGKSIRGGK